MRSRALVLTLTLAMSHTVRADSTTSCTIGTWATYCTTSSGSGGGGRGGIEGIAILVTAIAVVVASVDLSKGPANTDAKTALDVAAIPAIFPTPFALYFGEMGGEPLDDAGKDAWRHKLSIVGSAGAGVVRDATGKVAAVATAHVTLGHGRLGLDASGESMTDNKRYSAFDAHLLLRAPPRQHAVFALALGVRDLTFGGLRRIGFDAGLPSHYILSRDDKTGEPDILLTVRPGFSFASQGVDVHFGLGLVIPVAGHLALGLDGEAFSFGSVASFAATASLTTAL